MIPEFFNEKIRSVALNQAVWARANSALREDLLQEAYCQFLACGPIPSDETMFAKHWRAAQKKVASAVYKVANEQRRLEFSLDAINDDFDEPLIEATTADFDDCPTWIPSDPCERMAVVESCLRILDSGGTVQKNPDRPTWQALLQVPTHRINLGVFRSKAAARAGIKAACKKIIDWCSPICEGPGGTAEEFLLLHRECLPKPLLGDPLEAMIFLEEYKEIRPGHRYYMPSLERAVRRERAA